MFVQEQADELIAAVTYVKENLSGQIETWAGKIVDAFQKGNKVILMGNGGSASDAQHIAAEFVGRFKKERPSLPALALNTNSSTTTAIGNDYSYDMIFSRQVDGFAKEGDVVIGISTSGNSKNVRRCRRGGPCGGVRSRGRRDRRRSSCCNTFPLPARRSIRRSGKCRSPSQGAT